MNKRNRFYHVFVKMKYIIIIATKHTNTLHTNFIYNADRNLENKERMHAVDATIFKDSKIKCNVVSCTIHGS